MRDNAPGHNVSFGSSVGARFCFLIGRQVEK